MNTETGKPKTNPASILRALAFSAALTALAGLLIFFRLDTVPGLHIDEAWAGGCAVRAMHTNYFGSAGMNWYTGPFHVWAVEKTFSALGPGMFELRLAGAVLNTFVAGAGGFCVFLLFGLPSFLIFSVFVLLLPYYGLESRLAWEVTALQNFIGAILLAAAWRTTLPRRTGLAVALAASYATVVGTANHLIFVSLPFALATGFIIWTALNKNRRFATAIALLLLNLSCAFLMLMVKRKLNYEIWIAHGAVLAWAFWLWPALFALAGWRWQDALSGAFYSLIERASTPKICRALGYAAGAGLLAFLWFHATAFMGALSGLNIYKRIFSLDPGIALTAACFIWAALLMALVLRKSFSVIKNNGPENNSVLFPALTLVAYFACFTIFRNTNALRYYLLAYLVFAFAASALLPSALKRCGKKTLSFLALMPLLLFGITMKELIVPQHRRPLRFIQGWHSETSAHMTDLAWLHKKLENEGTCRFDGDPFINEPLRFLYLVKPWACDRKRYFAGNYCYTCTEPPYIK